MKTDTAESFNKVRRDIVLENGEKLSQSSFFSCAKCITTIQIYTLAQNNQIGDGLLVRRSSGVLSSCLDSMKHDQSTKLNIVHFLLIWLSSGWWCSTMIFTTMDLKGITIIISLRSWFQGRLLFRISNPKISQHQSIKIFKVIKGYKIQAIIELKVV